MDDLEDTFNRLKRISYKDLSEKLANNIFKGPSVSGLTEEELDKRYDDLLEGTGWTRESLNKEMEKRYPEVMNKQLRENK